MTNRKKQLAKIYYQNREVKYINISFGDEYHSIYIGPTIHISGKEKIITMHHLLIEHDGGKGKEFSISEWEIKDHLDKVQINHMDSGIMIEWISSTGNVKTSSFIPIVRILYIKVDDPLDHDDEEELPKGIIEK
jgi:hypothetical protein